jgi:enoyl-[acyl-carrier protein] reductase I
MLRGKRGVVLGVANKRSLAWGIAVACAEQGAELALTYQGERYEKSSRDLLDKLPGGPPLLLPCDVTCCDQIDALVDALREAWGRIDFVVHSLAFADPAELKGRFQHTTRAGFAQALDISCYSFIQLGDKLGTLMHEGGAVLALSYLGGERVVRNYNVMGVAKAALESAVRYLAHDLGPQGIRVNCISPGPVKTVSAVSIGDFGAMLDFHRALAPLRRNVTPKDVGNAAIFFLSEMSSAVTGAVLQVDAGYSIMGVGAGVGRVDPS